MSDVKFSSLELSDPTKKAIVDMGFEHMTEVQARTIPLLMQVHVQPSRPPRACLSFRPF